MRVVGSHAVKALYYEATQADSEDVRLMERIDRLPTESPFYGSRKRAVELSTPDAPVNRKGVQRLMRRMGLEAIYPKPKLRAAIRGHRIYPYWWLRNVSIQRADQVWSTDITYIPLACGLRYLAAIIRAPDGFGPWAAIRSGA